MNRILCLIPARGGSKGIPRKNLHALGGKPLIAWTIEQALEIQHDGPVDVVVSTDDAEIADVAEATGAEVPFIRPASLAEDTIATEPVVIHAIDQMSAAGREPDAVMLLQATSPVRHSETLTRALREFLETGVDSLVGVVPEAPFLWWDSNPPRADYAVDARPRRQDMTPEMLRYRETGSVYVTRTEVYRTHHNRLGGRIGLFIMDPVEGLDIDTALDLDLAEHHLTLLR